MKQITQLLALIALFFTGCVNLTPSGVYKSDNTLYSAELATVTAYEFFDLYVTWEYDNRAALSRWPEIKESADRIRVGAKQWFNTAYALRDAYAANPTPENENNLQRALNVLRAALTEASGYMVKSATNQ